MPCLFIIRISEWSIGHSLKLLFQCFRLVDGVRLQRFDDRLVAPQQAKHEAVLDIMKRRHFHILAIEQVPWVLAA